MNPGLGIDEIVQAFSNAGVMPGDLLMLHSDSIVLAQLPAASHEERCEIFFAALDRLLGPEGTLILPTFSYSFTKGEVFNVRNTPSTVGLLTNYFRSMPGVLRSEDPNFSVAARGKLAREATQIRSDDCFGEHSFFSWLEDQDAWLGGMGCAIDRFTFVHYLEQKADVNYRYFKEFFGIVEGYDETWSQRVRYFVRDIERQTVLDLRQVRALLLSQGTLRVEPVGRVALNLTRCSQFMTATLSLLAKNPSVLIVEGNPK